MKPEKANKSATFKKKRKQNMERVAVLVINYKSKGFKDIRGFCLSVVGTTVVRSDG